MAVVAMQILDPSHEASMIGAAPVRLRGVLVSTGHPPLTYKWYSTLIGAPTPTDTDTSIRVPPGGNPLDFQRALPLGSQILTLAAKDQPGETEAELQLVTHAGMAGGPAAPGATQPCVVHVLRATILAPAAGAALSRASATLEAKAPALWASDEYLAINQLQYVWRFAPVGNPPGRRSGEIAPGAPSAFDGTTPPPRLRWSGPLPSTLDTGPYALTLRVQRTSSPATGHEQPIAVTLVS